MNLSNTDSVISSFALAITSPVFLSTIAFESLRPKIKSLSTIILFTPAFSMSRMCLTVMRLSF